MSLKVATWRLERYHEPNGPGSPLVAKFQNPEPPRRHLIPQLGLIDELERLLGLDGDAPDAPRPQQ